MKLDEVLHKNALDLLDSTQATIVPVEPHGFVSDSRRQLYGIGRAEAVVGTQLSGAISQIHRQRYPLDLRVGAGQGKNLLCQFILLISIGLNQEFQKRHRRSDRGFLPTFDLFKQGGTPGPISWVIFEKINENVGVETDALSWDRKTLKQGSPYHDRRSRFR